MRYCKCLFAFVLTQILSHSNPLLAEEAFVILEYNPSAILRGTNSGSYLVQPGDTLARIVAQHYGYVPNQQDLFSQIVAQNPHAFVGGNPNRLLSGVTINLSGADLGSGNGDDEIYFF